MNAEKRYRRMVIRRLFFGDVWVGNLIEKKKKYYSKYYTITLARLPENEDTIAATMKDNTTAGPATDLATVPANTYTPHPNVAPMPKVVKSKTFNTRSNFSFPGSSSSKNVFFRYNSSYRVFFWNENIFWVLTKTLSLQSIFSQYKQYKELQCY